VTRISALCIAGGMLAALALSTTSAWAPTAVEYSNKTPSVKTPNALSGGNKGSVQGNKTLPQTGGKTNSIGSATGGAGAGKAQ